MAAVNTEAESGLVDDIPVFSLFLFLPLFFFFSLKKAALCVVKV
jgi:hypothetical protein